MLALSGIRAEEGRPVLSFFGSRQTGGAGPYWSAAQDERGVLYFGCEVVLSYDGEHWNQHPVPGSYGVRGLAVGPAGRLWVCAMNEMGYFDRTPGGTLGAYRSLIPLLPAGTPPVGEMWHVFAQGNGAIFVGSEAVFIWDGTRFTVHRLPGTRRLPSVQVDGKTYVIHLASGIWRVDGTRLTKFISAAALEQSAPLWIDHGPDGWLLVTSDGLRRWRDGKTTEVAPDASRFIRNNVLSAAYRTPHGTLCIGTLRHGVATVSADGEMRQAIDTRGGLHSPGVMFLFTDRDGAVWIGSSVELARAEIDDGVSVADARAGLVGKPSRSISQLGGSIVVGTDEGVFQASIGSPGAMSFTPVPELRGTCFDVLGRPDGLYAAGYKGVLRWRGGAPETVFSTNRDVIVVRGADRSDGLLLSDDNDLVRVSPEPGGRFSSSVVAHLPDGALEIADVAGRGVWVGTRSRGVFQIPDRPGATPLPYRLRDGTPSTGRGLVRRVGTSVVVCTSDGLEIVDPRSGLVTAVSGAPETPPLAISNAMDGGSVWIAFASPFADGNRVPVIGRLWCARGSAPRWESVALPGLDQLSGIDALHVDDRGVLWVGGVDGVLRVDPSGLHPVHGPHRPVLRATIAPGSRIRYGETAVGFDYAAVEYSRPESVRFETKLSDGSSGWSFPSDASHLTLAGLRDGAYEFSVRTINDAGLSSLPVSWQFTVLPPWYRTKLAYAGWVLLAVLGYIGSVQWRSAYLRRRNARLEELVRQKTGQLEQANAAKSEFLANMSHEIRNPISGIVGLSVAMEETSLNVRQRELAESIRSCASLLGTLVDDVLDFTKIEAGRIELRPAAFDLRAILRECVAMVAEDARRAGSTVAISVADAVPHQLVGDSARIQQIVLNYLTNAVKFGRGQPIAVEAVAGVDHRVRLSVRDHGAGMTAAEAATLFTKFTRLEQALGSGIQGTGLGLAVCRLLAEKMGGAVGVTSQPGEGSCFWLELPLAPAAAGPVPSVAEAPHAPLRALIAEDIGYNATAMQAVLRKLGIMSDVAADGPGALQRLESGAYDVAFMDWNLPGMIGTEVVRRYRAIEPPERRTIIVATTAYSADLNREACLAAGMDAFVAKPFTPEKVAAALRDLRGSLRAAASVVVEEPYFPSGEAPEIDLKLLRFLAGEAPGGLTAQIDRFLEEFETDRGQARQLLAVGTPADLHRIAHRLVSHASAVGYEPLVRLAKELQAHAATADRGRLADLFAAFAAEFARFRSKLDSFRSPAGPA